MARRGFFSNENTQIKVKGSGLAECGRCKLNKKCESPKIKPEGLGRKRILVVGESPGPLEDGLGVNFASKNLALLKEAFKENGVDLFKDCIITNAVICNPGKAPNSLEVSSCRPTITSLIEKEKPRLIFLLGKGAIESVIGAHWTKDNYYAPSVWRGYHIPDQKYKAWVCPTFHPYYVRRAQEALQAQGATAPAELLFKSDIASALKLLDTPVPDYGTPSEAVTILPTAMAKDLLRQLLDGPRRLVAFDYETTGLKPHKEEHFVPMVGISYERWKAFVWSMDTGDEELEDLWIEFLSNKQLEKAGANIKFEETWGRVIFGVETASWKMDTTIGAHVLDNRSGITSLKFQVYIRFGFAGYDQEVERYLKAKGSNGVNRVATGPRKKLLLYCGMDALFTLPIALDMLEEMENG